MKEDIQWMQFLVLFGGLVFVWLLAGWLLRLVSGSTKSNHGSQKSNCDAGNRMLRGMQRNKADCSVRKPSVKSKRTNRKTG
jgi:hypothetical protein